MTGPGKLDWLWTVDSELQGVIPCYVGESGTKEALRILDSALTRGRCRVRSRSRSTDTKRPQGRQATSERRSEHAVNEKLLDMANSPFFQVSLDLGYFDVKNRATFETHRQTCKMSKMVVVNERPTRRTMRNKTRMERILCAVKSCRHDAILLALHLHLYNRRAKEILERSDKRECQPLVNGRGRGYAVKTAVAGTCSLQVPLTNTN